MKDREPLTLTLSGLLERGQGSLSVTSIITYFQ